MRASRPASQRGMTLIEVLVSLMLVSMVATISASAYLFAFRGLLLSAQTVRAQGVAERALMSIYARPCDYLGEVTDTVVNEGLAFERTVSVSVLPGTQTWRFHSAVAWKHLGRRYHTEILTYSMMTIDCPQSGKR